jgi:hypothetical protein
MLGALVLVPALAHFLLPRRAPAPAKIGSVALA